MLLLLVVFHKLVEGICRRGGSNLSEWTQCRKKNPPSHNNKDKERQSSKSDAGAPQNSFGKRGMSININILRKSLFASLLNPTGSVRGRENLFTISPIFYLLATAIECLSCDLLYLAVFRNHHHYTLTVMNKTSHRLFVASPSGLLSIFLSRELSKDFDRSVSGKDLGETLFE